MIEKLDQMVRAAPDINQPHAHGSAMVAQPAASIFDVVKKVNEIIDRLNAEPTLDEVIAALTETAYASDRQLAVSLRRARERWKELRDGD